MASALRRLEDLFTVYCQTQNESLLKFYEISRTDDASRISHSLLADSSSASGPPTNCWLTLPRDTDASFLLRLVQSQN
jgi:hypothetical protein